MVGMRHDRGGGLARPGSRETEGHRAAMAGMPILVLAVVIIFALALDKLQLAARRGVRQQAGGGPASAGRHHVRRYRGQAAAAGRPPAVGRRSSPRRAVYGWRSAALMATRRSGGLLLARLLDPRHVE